MASQAVISDERSPQAPATDHRRLLDRLAIVLAVVQAALLYRFMSVGSWFLDDFQNLELAQMNPLSREYLQLTVFGHPQPGNRLVNWLLIRAFPMNYQVAAALVAAGIGLTAFTVYRILRNLYPPSPLHLVFASMAGATAMWLPTGEWWAGGSGVTTCALTSALSCASLVRCYLTARGPRRALWGLLAGFWMLLGLMFYERTLFGCLFGALFLPAAVCRRVSPRELLRVLRRAWVGYLSLIVVAAGFLAYYLTGSFVRKQPGYTTAEVVEYLWVAWSRALVPALFGGPIRTEPLGPESTAGTPLWWLVTTQLAVLAITVWGVRRLGWRALRGWVILLPIFLVAQYSIATARLAGHGPRIGNEFRYISDVAVLAVLALAVVLMRPGPDPDQPNVAADAEPSHAVTGWLGGAWRGLNRRHLLITGVFLLVTWTVFLTSAVPISRRWSTAPGRTYVPNLQQGIEAADARGPWSLYTTMVPHTLSLTTYGRYSTSPFLARLVSGHEVSVDDLRRPMYVVDRAGHLVPATFQTRSTVALACSTRSKQQVFAPLKPALGKENWTIRFRYKVAEPSMLRFAVHDGTRYIEATGSFRGFPVRGSGELTFMLRGTAIKVLRLDAQNPGICLTDVRIGRPVPAS
ncbi:MAG TPA: hypothetical protein VGB75_12445 [Jatrophihabitans sp.]|uniref:hypothetical protein n=1 Tax=Jatrophihabitans sp. TaxID=1932789 RepID=UPI002EE44EE0